MKLQLKRSNVLESGFAKAPTSAQMEYGELAVNYNLDDPCIFLKDSNNNIIRISGKGMPVISDVNLQGGTLDDRYPLKSGDTMTGELILAADPTTNLAASTKQYVDNLVDAIDLPTETAVGSSPPSNPISGEMWWSTETGNLYIYYVDGDSSQWVESNPPSHGEVDNYSVTPIKLSAGGPSWDASGNATFAGDVAIGGSVGNHTVNGIWLESSGDIRVTGTSSNTIWSGYDNGNAAATSKITANGNADFAGDGIFRSTLTVTGSTGNGLYVGDSAEILLKKDGSATFNNTVTAKQTSNNAFSVFEGVDANGTRFKVTGAGVLSLYDNNLTENVQISGIGSASFAGEIKVEGSSTPTGLYSGISRYGSLLIGTSSEAVGDARLAIDASNGNITSVGSATFASSIVSQNNAILALSTSSTHGLFVGKTSSTGNLDNDYNASIRGDGSAKFGGNVQLGLNPEAGAGEGILLRKNGRIELGSNQGSTSIWSGYKVGTSTATSQILADGSASFTGAVTTNGISVFNTPSLTNGGQLGYDDPTKSLRLYSNSSLGTNASTQFYFNQSGTPDIIFNQGASAQFGPFNAGSTTTYGVAIDQALGSHSSVRSQCTSTSTTVGELFAGYRGNTAVFQVTTGGAATFAGNITAANVSDIKFKENITVANPQLADVVTLGNSLKNWNWKEEAPLNEDLRSRRFLGLIAQEAEEVCPSLTYEVGEGEESYKAINHDILVMKLLGAVAEQQATIKSLESRISQLEGN